MNKKLCLGNLKRSIVFERFYNNCYYKDLFHWQAKSIETLIRFNCYIDVFNYEKNDDVDLYKIIIADISSLVKK